MPSDIVLESLQGGLNTTDAPNALRMDECTIADNVEFFYSTLGERRLGGQALDLTGSGIASDEAILHLARHFPSANELDNELWAFSAIVGTSVRVSRRTATGWTTITPTSPISAVAPEVYQIQTLSFDGNLYVCAKLVSGADRMLIWDGTSLRLAGLAEPPAAPAVADEGSGTFTETRYYRVRYVVKDGTTVLRRSEPSETTTFAPSGTGAGARITKPAAINEGETDWEVEASSNGADYYRIATVVVGTTTYDDTTNLATTSYADEGPLSADIGEYIPLPAAQFAIADDDRVVLGASWVQDSQDSRASWTPVRNAPGVGNGERIPADIDSFLDLNPKEGGGLTGLGQTTNGSWYALKGSHIYQMTRTGFAADAYVALTLSKAVGAMFGSLVTGLDEFGRACLYFADQRGGPHRVGASGLQQLQGIRNTWGTVNAAATKVAIRGVYYPFKQQVWWVVATNGSDVPNYGLKLQVNKIRGAADGGGVSGGWSTFTGLLSEALTMTVLSEVLTNTTTGYDSLSIRPILGYASPDYLLRGDVTDTDNNTAYLARIRSRPLFQAGLLNRWGAMSAALLAMANRNAYVEVSFIRNYGLEKNSIVTRLEPQGDEAYVLRVFDNLVMSSAISIQVEFSDRTDPLMVLGQLYHVENP